MTRTPTLPRWFCATLGAGLLAAGLPAADQNPTQNQPPSAVSGTNTNTITAQEFVQKAALSGQKEIFLSQLALSKAQDPQVQWLAKQMVQDHTAANQQLHQTVEAVSLRLPATNAFAIAVKPSDVQPVRDPASQPPPPSTQPGAAQIKVEPKDVKTAEQLQSLSGPAFDKAYIQAMVQDHQEAVKLFQQAQNVSDPQLRKFAEQTLPKLQYHLEHAQKLSGIVK